MSNKSVSKEDKMDIMKASISASRREFVNKSAELTSHTMSTVGTDAELTGLALMAVPGAQPAAAGLLVAGRTLNTVGSAVQVTSDLLGGNFGRAAMNTAVAGAGVLGSRVVSNQFGVGVQAQNQSQFVQSLLGGSASGFSLLGNSLYDSSHRKP